MALQVKYGVITLIKQTVDLCEQVKNVELDCPLEGNVRFTKEVELPREIPPVRTKSRIVFTWADCSRGSTRSRPMRILLMMSLSFASRRR